MHIDQAFIFEVELGLCIFSLCLNIMCCIVLICILIEFFMLRVIIFRIKAFCIGLCSLTAIASKRSLSIINQNRSFMGLDVAFLGSCFRLKCSTCQNIIYYTFLLIYSNYYW